VLAVAACAGGVGNPEAMIKKMVKAYGGPGKVHRLQTFVGKGFIKEPSQAIASSNAFDLYMKGPLYKHKVYRAPGGKLSDVIILCFDGRESHEWMKGRGLKQVPTMELAFSKYRFPAVLEWAQSASLKGEILPSGKRDRDVRVRYRDGDVSVTLDIDRKSRLLNGVELGSASDTSFSYVEAYGNYWNVDGIPFPGTFKASFKGQPYFDYVFPFVELGAQLPDSLFKVTEADTAAITAASKAAPPEPLKPSATAAPKSARPEPRKYSTPHRPARGD
jgi:hypothetical protein